MDCNDQGSPADRGMDILGGPRRPWHKPTLDIVPISATATGSGSTCEGTSVSDASQSS